MQRAIFVQHTISEFFNIWESLLISEISTYTLAVKYLIGKILKNRVHTFDSEKYKSISDERKALQWILRKLFRRTS